MCVLAVAWRAHPDWQLVVAANRDEMHGRPTEPLARWHNTPKILAGRDVLAGGTWMGVSEEGRFAAVTNVRGGGKADRESRGALVRRVLGLAELNLDADDASRFNPFNLLTADLERLVFTANAPDYRRLELSPGIYGVSNGELDAPWAKTVQLKRGLARWLERDVAKPRGLFDLLFEGAVTSFDLTQKGAPASPIFIRNLRYGTRCSTVVMINAAGDGLIAERRFSPDAELDGSTMLSFNWPAQGHDASPA